MTTRKFKFGEDFDKAESRDLTHRQAREFARCQRDRGYVWMCYRNHWTIVANYNDGRVWNGQAHCVPCKPDPKEDWDAMAKTRG